MEVRAAGHVTHRVRKLSPSFEPHVDVCAEKGTPIIELGARLSRALAAKRQATA